MIASMLGLSSPSGLRTRAPIANRWVVGSMTEEINPTCPSDLLSGKGCQRGRQGIANTHQTGIGLAHIGNQPDGGIVVHHERAGLAIVGLALQPQPVLAPMPPLPMRSLGQPGFAANL